MAIQRKILKANELVSIYFMYNNEGGESMSYASVARATGNKEATIASALKYIEKYWDFQGKQPNRQYAKAIEKIKARLSEKKLAKEKESLIQGVTSDIHYKKFDQDFVAFQQSLADFIKADVNAKSEAIINELAETKKKLEAAEKEIKRLKGELEEANKVVAAAKTSNISSFLRNDEEKAQA